MNTPTWNSGEHEKAHGANWRKWLGHLKDTPACGLELGTWKGESAEWMLNSIFTHEMSEYYCIDTFAGSEEHHLAGIDCSKLEEETRARLAPYQNRVVIFKGESHQSLHEMCVIRELKLDFVYIDAAHDAMNVLRDAVLAFDILKVGGILVFDDLTWTVMPNAIDCPRMAIEALVACYAKQVEVIGMGSQLALKRTA